MKSIKYQVSGAQSYDHILREVDRANRTLKPKSPIALMMLGCVLGAAGDIMARQGNPDVHPIAQLFSSYGDDMMRCALDDVLGGKE